MTEGSRDILLCSTADWDNPFWTNKQHMATQFAEQGYRVLYVDSLGLRRPTLGGRDIRRMLRRLGKALPIPRQVRPNIWRISPLVIPFHSTPAVRRMNDLLLLATFRWHMRLLGFRRPLVWTYNPLLWELFTRLPRCGLVYHCVDKLKAAPGVDGATIDLAERRLAAMADLCFTTSPALQAHMAGLAKRSIYESNVCDFPHFRQARSPLPEPPELAALPRPRLIFVGALSQYKVDFALMEQVARALPQVQWLLVGQAGEGQPGSSPPPAHLPNVHLLGPRPYADLPRYLAHADAAVLPVPHNAYTAAMFPMKFFEYLAAGLPVITTDLPALRDFASLCFTAQGPEAFARAVSDVLAGRRRDQAAIDAACAEHSWEARFRRMETAFAPLLSRPD